MSDLKPGPVKPVQLKKDGDRLAIQWSDGLTSSVTWQYLREQCPCANCREERVKPPDPFRILTAKDLEGPSAIAPVSMAPVGYYAYKIVWNDRHDSGIYTIEQLRELCEQKKN